MIFRRSGDASLANDPRPVSAPLAPPAAAAIASILVGAAIVASRYAIHQIGPGSLAFMRYLIALCCLVPLLLGSNRMRFEPRDVGPIALLGIAQFGILIVLLNVGLETLPAPRASLIFSSFPLLTILVGALLGRERPTALKTVGVLLTFAGVAYALWAPLSGDTKAGSTGIGDLAVFGSALCGAVCSVLYRPYVQKYSSLQVSVVATLAAVVFLALVAGWEGFFTGLPRLSGQGWLAVLFIGISSGFGYYLWLWALGHSTPTRVTAFVALSPITASALGTIFLAEPVSSPTFVGLVLVVAGLVLAHAESDSPNTGRQGSKQVVLRRPHENLSDRRGA